MDLNIIYKYGDREKPLTRIKNNTLTIYLPSQYYIEQEEKKLLIAIKSFNDPMIDKMYKSFITFKSNFLQ